MTPEELGKNIFQDNTILFNINGVLKKIFKITPHSDGGFNIHMPYHKERSGYLYTIKVPYKEGDFSINYKDSTTQEYISELDVKLSIHKSGFVQFSRDSGVISGIDQMTGKPKGLGIRIDPLENPIQSGPTFGVHVWGLDGFYTLNAKKNKKHYIEFKESDFIYNDCTKEDFNSYHVGAWVFPNLHQKFITEKNNELQIMRSFGNYLPDPNKIFVLKVILIKNSPSFIALFCERVKIGKEFGETGYNLNGPSQILPEKVEGYKVGEHIRAAYPRPIFMENKDIKTIHRDTEKRGDKTDSSKN